MAIFHLELRQIKRQTKIGKIKKVSAIVAYRERMKIDNFDYSKKQDFITSFCLFPPEFQNSEYAKNLKNAEFFASEIEKIEKRKDSQLFDELILALPHELPLEKNKQIIEKLITEHYISKNSQMARVCIHRSKNNLHAHILIPQRPLENTENGVKFGKKLRPEFNKFRKPKSTEKLTKMRQDWAEIVNNKLTEVGSSSKISHLSLKNRRTEALISGDYEMAAKFDRPAIYLPTSAHNPKYRLITKENDRFMPDFEKMEEAKKYYAKRHNLESYTWDNLIAEREFWDVLEQAGRIKIGVGMAAIRKMVKRFIKVITNNPIFQDSQNDQRRRIDTSKKNTATICQFNNPTFESVFLDLQRISRNSQYSINFTDEFNNQNNQKTIQTPETTYDSNYSIRGGYTKFDELSDRFVDKPISSNNLSGHNGKYQNRWEFKPTHTAKQNRPFKKR